MNAYNARRFESSLYDTYGTGSVVDAVTVQNNDVVMLPPAIYPLRGVNQIVVYWVLTAMPTAGTYVSITPVVLRGFNPNLPRPVFFKNNVTSTEIFTYEWDKLDSPSGSATPHNYELVKTSIDATVTIHANGTDIGTRHSMPVSDDFWGIWIRTDGTTNTGGHSLFVEISYA